MRQISLVLLILTLSGGGAAENIMNGELWVVFYFRFVLIKYGSLFFYPAVTVTH
jgi:hypothetical protein